MDLFSKIVNESVSKAKLDAFMRYIREKYPELQSFDLMAYGPSKDKDVIELNHIMVLKSKRKQGIGTKVMQELVDFADQNNYWITLSVADKDSGIGTTSSGRLYSFYRRFGFVSNHGRNKRYELSIYASMYRKPNS